MPLSYNLHVAVWMPKFGTTAPLNLDAKKLLLSQAVERANLYLKGVNSSLTEQEKTIGAVPVYVFVAPEYYWIKTGNYQLYSLEEKATIYSSLKTVSANNENVLMFPGTVNWQVPKAQNDVKKPFLGYNACPVYLGGNLLLDYHKKFNDHILDDSKGPASFAAGPAGGAQHFTSGSLKYGVDICGDLNKGQLSLTLNGETVDVMVVTAGSMAHNFCDDFIATIPVRDGGAFIHCDNSAKSERNGVWVLQRGSGWHGATRHEAQVGFADLDNVSRVIGYLPSEAQVHGNTMKISTRGGFGALRELDATDITFVRGNVKTFNLAIPGRKPQEAHFARDGEKMNITLKRPYSFTKVRSAKILQPDMEGMRTSGNGNVSKIGKLHKTTGDASLVCYTVPITK